LQFFKVLKIKIKIGLPNENDWKSFEDRNVIANSTTPPLGLPGRPRACIIKLFTAVINSITW
jgi:hypothetical protein